MKKIITGLWKSGDWMFALPLSFCAFALAWGAVQYAVRLLSCA